MDKLQQFTNLKSSATNLSDPPEKLFGHLGMIVAPP